MSKPPKGLVVPASSVSNRSLELSGDEFTALVQQATGYLSEFLDSLPQQPAVQESDSVAADGVADAELSQLYPAVFPGAGVAANELLESLFRRLVPVGYNPASPGYLAFIPGGGLPESAVADLISNIVNRYLGLRRAAPLLAAIDDTVIRWFCQLVGYDSSSGGYLSPGGSIANLTAIVTARHHQLGDEFFRGTLYTSNQTHHSITKAAVHAGFRRDQIRLLPVDAAGRLDLDHARRVIEQDRRDGFNPFLLVSHAGTTNTGAVDDLQASAALARAQQMWWHVDAAYGGFFMLTERGQRLMQGLAGADSITMDPHKGLFLPYGTGCLLVKDRVRLRDACDIRGEYMPRDSADGDRWDACDLSPEQTRDFRGLRIWLPVMLHGITAFRENLDEKLDLALRVFRRLEQWRESGQPWALETPPELSVVAFRLDPPGWAAQQVDALNRRLLEEINRQGTVLLSPTLLQGRVALRLCVLSFRTHLEHIERALEVIEAAAENVLGSASIRPH